MEKHLLNHCLRNQFQELKIKAPRDTKYIAISDSILPRAKYVFFYNSESFIQNKILGKEKYEKLEKILSHRKK